jgi:asparagine synthase (glutamine-hydrolysing)
LIQGSFSLSDAGTTPLKHSRITVSAAPEALFHMVAHDGFTGGYYLHPRLPHADSDHYFYDTDNDILVLLYGSVFNRSELLQICSLNVPVPDPELVAGLFLLKEADFVTDLNGDFAIFICRPSKKEAFLFRDHVGISPLAWIIEDQTLYFSTDITGLCQSFSNSRNIETEYLLGYFKFIDYRKTPFEKVKKLLPGHYLHFSGMGIEIVKFWMPEKIKTNKKLSYDRTVSDLRSLLIDSVRIRCDNRFIAGAHVSSGLDSGIVSLLARKEYTGQDIFYGFSWSPATFTTEAIKYDERQLVIKSCSKTNILPVFSDMNMTDFPQFVSGFYDNHGFFSEDKTIDQAVKLKTNLIFSGWGGDEFISTDERGIGLDLLRALKLRLFLKRNHIKPIRKFIGYLLLYIIYPAMGILGRGLKRALRDDNRYIKKAFRIDYRDAVQNFYFYRSRKQNHLGLLQVYHLQERCESWAVTGFRKGVEYRYPLLDKRIIEYLLKVPTELLCKSDLSRPLMRKICEDILPEEVRLNYFKNDPVYWNWMDELFKGSAISFMEEVSEWKDNEELRFVDFELLEEDINKFKKSTDSIDLKVLFRAMVYIKAVHEFTKKYRESN